MLLPAHGDLLLYPVLLLLLYMLKAPLVKSGMLSIWHRSHQQLEQQNALETFLKGCVWLEGNSDLLLDTGFGKAAMSIRFPTAILKRKLDLIDQLQVILGMVQVPWNHYMKRNGTQEKEI
ncbi:hypothetical protein C8J56DRAFT_883604 [Mycena floridula]|nr:hypothetical protein C8J56DRAFT_883604 [Mycena floridula]